MAHKSENKPNKRAQIIEAADELFYRNGYAHTSFADIANAVKISRGNFYYHFKTKDEILADVIVRRLQNTQMMLDKWQNEGTSPTQRIECFIKILIANQSKIKLYGCPVGSLTTEMAKLDHPMGKEAGKVFQLFQIWLAKQFRELGHIQDAQQLALHLLARSQGIATLYNAYGDDDFLHAEVNLLIDWLNNKTAAQ